MIVKNLKNIIEKNTTNKNKILNGDDMKYKLGLFIQNIRIKIEVWYLQFFGYIDKDYCPIKCTCGSKDLEDCNEDWLNGREIRLEYDCRCKKCGKILSHWAYGHWEIW